ncbi:lymphokine-activated killer T-cell-originated protein kinase homolog [Uranotaenia lowii]|uniref:lymphokine-activated killer T-cell-originated protein kinase homolog n=1 Tax=Uranotaenia lowii TaxID=190385 RepID=UPI0024789982|nr:lymphokine-activated killer T-cell-originated protein kinase homolog [Uranotaenia lowii]
METPLKTKLLSRLQQGGDGFQTPAGTSGDRSAKHLTSVTKLPASPFLKKLGFGTGVEVLRIKRSPTKNSTKSPWAIKMLSRRTNPEMSKLVGDRLTEEANILKKLDHPNIVGYRGFDSLEAGKEYIAMEYCNVSLGDMLEERYNNGLGPLEAPKIQRMIGDVLAALDYLHTKAMLLHGDLKSFNVLVKNDFEACKLCDFGVSLPLNKEGFLDTEKKPDAQYVGTAIWSAPEVLEEDPTLISSKADIFSFGLIVYETISLLPPHTFTGMKDESIASSADYAMMKSIIRSGNPQPQTQPQLALNRKLNLSEVIVVDEDTGSEKNSGENKRKLEETEPSKVEEPEPKKSAPETGEVEPDSTTADNNSIIEITDDSILKAESSAITINDTEGEEELDEEEEDEDEDGEDDEFLEDKDEGDFLDYGRVGTRPAIPDGITLSEDYNFIMEIFYVCTQEDYEARPSARSLIDAWNKQTGNGETLHEKEEASKAAIEPSVEASAD